MIVSETLLVARYNETDQMGIIHHAIYPVWFEVARTELLDKLGMKYSKVEQEGILLPLTELKCRYISPVKYEDEVIIRTKISSMGCVRLTFHYEVFKKEGMDLIVSGETLHAWTDKNLKPINIKKRKPILYESLQGGFCGKK